MREGHRGDGAEIVAQTGGAGRVHRACQRPRVFYPGGMLKTNAGGHNALHMHYFYRLLEWQRSHDRYLSQTHKLLIMAERCRRLGIVRPSERSVAAIVAILYGDA